MVWSAVGAPNPSALIRNALVLFVLISAVFASGCRSPRVLAESNRQPGFVGVQYSKPTVLVLSNDLQFRRAIESRVVNGLKTGRVDAERGEAVFRHGDDLTQQEYVEILSEYDRDALMFIRRDSRRLFMRSVKGPVVTSGGERIGKDMNATAISERRADVRQFYEDLPSSGKLGEKSFYSAWIFDLSAGKKVWESTIYIDAKRHGDAEDIWDGVSRAVLGELSAAHIFEQSPDND